MSWLDFRQLGVGAAIAAGVLSALRPAGMSEFHPIVVGLVGIALILAAGVHKRGG